VLLYLEAKTKPLYSAHTMRRIGKISSLLWIGAYSPNCLEGEFCELRDNGVLRSSLRKFGKKASHFLDLSPIHPEFIARCYR